MNRESQVREFAETDRPGCARVLATLPDWFGIEEANTAYIEILGRIPTAVVELGGEVLGFAALQQHNHASVELHILAVDRDHHHQGLGSRLTTWAQTWCVQTGVRWLHVKTRGPSTPDPGYERTRKFYHAQGFEELFESLTLWGAEDAALIMIKKLDP
jgi:GNAT superfamily N-acetyltransferase